MLAEEGRSRSKGAISDLRSPATADRRAHHNCLRSHSPGIEVLVVPGGRLLAFLAIAAVIGVLAAVRPARRAAKLQVLGTIATT